jgi:glutamate-5-semialdehyde dehydrogenase
MAVVTPLRALAKGTQLLFGGDRLITVPDELVERFRPGDALVVVEATEQVLLLPAAERARVAEVVGRARQAFELVRSAPDAVLCRFFDCFAAALESEAIWARVHDANQRDVADARSRGRSTTRLVASDDMRRGMIAGLRGWITAASRRDQVLERVEHDGWQAELVGAALGVVGFVFEGRPNVLADATGVLRSGNTVVFRIGSDALGTARAIMEHALRPALVEAGLPEDAVCLIESAEHAAGWALFTDRRLSLAVARGSGPTVETLGALAQQAGVPVSLHGTGGAWIVASERAEPSALEAAVFDSLDRKVCNTLNTLAIPEAAAAALVPAALQGMTRAGARLGGAFKLHVAAGSERHVPSALFEQSIDVRRAEGTLRERHAQAIALDRLGHEHEWEGTPELTLVVVRDVAHAVELFNRHSPHFVASLIGGDAPEHAAFYDAVDAAFVGDGATRWVDGQKALRQPELGLSSWQWGRLFGRGGILTGDGVYTVRTRARRR